MIKRTLITSKNASKESRNRSIEAEGILVTMTLDNINELKERQ
jgi:hypothetical protein